MADKNIIMGNDAELLEFYRAQFQLQREIMDRWFGYYLLINGAPYPVLASLLQVGQVSKSITEQPEYMRLCSVGFCSVSVFCFFSCTSASG
jgi:hypothetical protein